MYFQGNDFQLNEIIFLFNHKNERNFFGKGKKCYLKDFFLKFKKALRMIR